MDTREKNYLTPTGLKSLKDEYFHLVNEERPKIVETVAWAASNGDRSENADYIYGKRRLREIDSRLRFLSGQIENAFVVDPATVKAKNIVFGATVTVENEDGVQQTFQIVGGIEADPASGKVSWKSPLARCLLGKAINDEVVLKKPNGEENLEIVGIVYK